MKVSRVEVDALLGGKRVKWFGLVIIPTALFTAGQEWHADTLFPQLVPLTATAFKMADDEVATKAPESDAKEPSMVSSEDTPAQTGASMGVRTPAIAKP